MSYQDLAGRNGGPSQLTSLQGPNRQAEALLLKLANNITVLKRQVDTLGTPKDTVSHRHKLADLNNTIQDLARQIKDVLSRSHEASAASPETAVKHKKLLQDFAALLQDYKSTQKLAQERETSFLPKPDPGTTPARGQAQHVVLDIDRKQQESESERQALLQAQKTAAQESELQLHDALIQERDTGIRDIVRQIGEVNEMFQDLAVLINDQGAQVQTIDNQIGATAERTKAAAQELVKAQRSNRNYRNKCLWFALIAAVIASIILIIILS